MKPIGFAHRGGKADARENTLDAFRTALENGATGLESDVLMTADGIAVLAHDDDYWRIWPLGRSYVSRTNRNDLPPHIPAVDELFALSGDVDVFLDIKSSHAATKVIETASGALVTRRLWLAHESHKTSDRSVVTAWRDLDPDVRLVDSSNFPRIAARFEPYVKELAEMGIEALNLPAKDWTSTRIDACRSHGVRPFAFGAHTRAALRHALSLGVDAVFSDHTKRMMQAIDRYGNSSSA